MPEHSTPFPLDEPGTPAAARCYALIPCAGSGSRSGLGMPKQYEVLAGQRLIDHTVQAFLQAGGLSGIGVVLAPDDAVYRAPNPLVRAWHVGGATRAHSVFNGLIALQGAGARDTDWVLVHDAARCLITPAQIQALIAACADDAVGGLLALPLADTLKTAQATPEGDRAVSTVPRSDKWQAQTPQMFRLGVLHRALLHAELHGFAGVTDESSAIEALGLRPLLVRGSAQNFKLTYPEDFALAEALLHSRSTR